jgi:hypothetical protein
MFAFEIDNAFVSRRGLVQLLSDTAGVERVERRRLFGPSPDVHITFQFGGRPFMVWEAYGDSSRYWIGPDDDSDPAAQTDRLDVGVLETSFRERQTPAGIGWLTSLAIAAWAGYVVGGKWGLIIGGGSALSILSAHSGWWRRTSQEPQR